MSACDTNATICVLVPVQGDGAFLAQTLTSLQAQTFPHWQAQLCPSNATAAARARVLAADWPQLHVNAVCVDTITAITALADAANASPCEWLCVLDGADTLAPTALATLHAALLAQPDAGMAYSRHVLIDAQGRVLGPGPLCELPYSPDALLLVCMTGPLRLLRHAAYRAAGGYRNDYPDAADYDLCLRLSETTHVVHVPQPLYQRRIHPQAAEVARWGEQIEDRYRAFVAAVQRRGLDAQYDTALEIDSWHVLQARRPFGGIRGLP